MTDYCLILDDSAHQGHRVDVPQSEWWTPENPGGTREQHLTGSHGRVEYYSSAKEADEALERWLDCPAARRGGYCYTHNPEDARTPR